MKPTVLSLQKRAAWLAAASALFIAAPAHAAPTWKNTSGDSTWSTTSSGLDWSTNTLPTASDIATFTSTGGGGTIAIGSGTFAPTALEIQFGSASAPAYVLGTSPGSGSINLDTTATSGSGTIVLYSTTANSAVETINANLVVGNSTDTASYFIINQTAGVGSLINIAGNVTRSSTTTGSGVGVLNLSNTTATYTGGITISGSISGFSGVNVLNSPGSTVTLSGNNGDIGGINLGNSYKGNYGNLLIETSTLTGKEVITNYSGGTDAGTVQFAGNVSPANTIVFANGRSAEQSGGFADVENVSGNNSIGALNFGTGFLANNVGSYANVKLDTGTLSVASIGNQGTSTSPGARTAIFYGGGNAVVLGAISDAATPTTPISLQEDNAGGTVTLQGAGNYVGGTSILNGTLQVGNGGTSGALGSGGITDNASLVYNRSDSVTETNTITGTGSVTLAGSGTLSFNQANTYGNGTTVSKGTFLAANTLGSATGSGNVLVKNGAVFGGNGIVNPTGTSTFTIAAGGILAPGSPGTTTSLTVSASGNTTPGLIALAGAQLNFNLNAGLKSSELNLTGAFGGEVTGLTTNVFNFTDLSGGNLASGNYTLIQTDSTTNPFASALGNYSVTGLNGYTSQLQETQVNGDYDLQLDLASSPSVVPEPSVVSLLLLGGVVVFLVRRRTFFVQQKSK